MIEIEAAKVNEMLKPDTEIWNKIIKTSKIQKTNFA